MAYRILKYKCEGPIDNFTTLGEPDHIGDFYETDVEAIEALDELVHKYSHADAEVEFVSQDRFFLINSSNRVYRMYDVQQG